MSWLGGYKPSTSKPSEADLREEKRKKLEAERGIRAQKRDQHQKELEAIAKSRAEANKAYQELLDIEPDLLVSEELNLEESEIEQLLSHDTIA